MNDKLQNEADSELESEVSRLSSNFVFVDGKISNKFNNHPLENSEKPITNIPSVSISSLSRDGSRSAFTPYKPSTVLTNLQRGNVQTQALSVLPERSIHQLAAQGELFLHNIDSDFDINKRDEYEQTPLMWAASYGQLETVRLLLNRGALTSAVGSHKENALLLACVSGHVAVVKELIKHGAPLDHRDENGNSALMYTAYNNHAMCAHELLMAGADLTLINEVFESAFDIAIKRRSKQVQAILEKHMMTLLLEAKEIGIDNTTS